LLYICYYQWRYCRQQGISLGTTVNYNTSTYNDDDANIAHSIHRTDKLTERFEWIPINCYHNNGGIADDKNDSDADIDINIDVVFGLLERSADQTDLMYNNRPNRIELIFNHTNNNSNKFDTPSFSYTTDDTSTTTCTTMSTINKDSDEAETNERPHYCIINHHTEFAIRQSVDSISNSGNNNSSIDPHHSSTFTTTTTIIDYNTFTNDKDDEENPSNSNRRVNKLPMTSASNDNNNSSNSNNTRITFQLLYNRCYHN
jgi:hypothetical protein